MIQRLKLEYFEMKRGLFFQEEFGKKGSKDHQINTDHKSDSFLLSTLCSLRGFDINNLCSLDSLHQQSFAAVVSLVCC